MSAFDSTQAAFLLGALCRFGLAVIFAHSSWHALREMPAFEAAVSGYRLLPPRAAPIAARTLPALNLAAATLVILPATSAAGARLGAALLGLFAGAMFVNLRRGRAHIECGCGGAQNQHISSGLVCRNLALLTLLLATTAAPAQLAVNAADLICILGGAAGLVALYFTASQLLANSASFRAAGERAWPPR